MTPPENVTGKRAISTAGCAWDFLAEIPPIAGSGFLGRERRWGKVPKTLARVRFSHRPFNRINAMYDEDYMLAQHDHARGFFHELPPYWYDPASRACEHRQGDDVRQIGSQVAASDGAYVQLQCGVCGRLWSRFIEG